MAFTFKNLSVTLMTEFVNGVPEAKLLVGTCAGLSLVMRYSTCGTDTQPGCNTNPEEMKLLDAMGDPGDLKELQQQLEEMLEKFGPDGTTPDGTTTKKKKKKTSPARSTPSSARGTKRGGPKP